MFDLEPAIAEWRAQLAAKGIVTSETLDELVSHLREAVESRLASGSDVRSAFEYATRQMGQIEILRDEFEKTGETNKRNCMNFFGLGKIRRPYAGMVLTGIAAVFALMVYNVWRHPASLGHGGFAYFSGCVIALLSYSGMAFWARTRATDVTRLALGCGVRIGLVLGAASLANISTEYFTSLNSAAQAVLGVTMWGLWFLSFGAAGSATFNQTRSLFQAVVSSLWSAIVAAVITLFYGFTTCLLFMPYLQRIFSGAFRQSEMTDSHAFVILNTLNAAASHVLLLPCMAVLFGFAGGYAGEMLESVRRRTAVGLGFLECALLGAGLFSIHFALSLDRSDRPPFIIGGLLAFGTALACAHPVFTAIRRRLATES